MGRKLGAVPLLGEGELRPNLTQRRLGRGLLRTKWQLDPSSRLTTIHMGQKLGELGPHRTQSRLG